MNDVDQMRHGLAPAVSRRARRVVRRALTKGSFVLGDRILTVNPDGHRLYLSPADLSLTPTILTRRFYEPGTTRFLSRTIRPGFHVVDIGANVGWHTLMAAERVGSTGVVWAFEPNPQSFALLHDSIFINGLWDRCHAVQAAVGRQDGMATLFTPGDFFGGARLRSFSEGELAWQRQVETTSPVEVLTLDRIYQQAGTIDLIKMDIEGAEPDVLAGGAVCLSECRTLTLVLEYTPKVHGQQLLLLLESYGFALHTVNRWGMTTLVKAKDVAAPDGSFDLVACRKAPM